MRGKVEHRIFPNMKNKSRIATRFALLSALALVSLLATGCAGLFGQNVKGVTVAKSERLHLRVAPFDSVVTAEVRRAGLDPVSLHQEFASEVRYRLFLRGQVEAPDSASATVSVLLSVKHLQAGFGNAGSYGEFSLESVRPENADRSEVTWRWQATVKDNVPEVFATRHLARLAAQEALEHLKEPKKDYEPPPPLHLMR
jgi:hypothetical protein